MRPESIKKFDILYLASILVGMIGTIMNFSSIEVQAAGTMLTPTTLVVITVITYALTLLLWYFISRRASNIAKWILVVLTLIGLIGLPSIFVGEFNLNKFIGLASTILSVAGVYFLFKPDARAWFAGETVDDPETLDRTFD
tara:strand:+ start:611 stop:1033 length:423 start_codon:yes stop_codon:yes gene_type:complete